MRRGIETGSAGEHDSGRGLGDERSIAVPLFEGNLRFYGREHAPGAARAFLAERLERGESIVFLAENGGFAQVHPPFLSTRLALTWVLNDLFVADTAFRHDERAL